jgi:protein phosphatase
MSLIGNVKEILQNERVEGKLRERIPDIQETQPFVENGVVYLPKEGTAYFIGDLHGDFTSLKRILEQTDFIRRVKRGEKIYLVFLGDYAGRGEKQIEVVWAVLKLKELFPKNVFLLRGNHENFEMAWEDGFIDVLLKKFGEQDCTKKIWPSLLNQPESLVNYLPVAVVTRNGVVGLHGGLPVVTLVKNQVRKEIKITKLQDFADPDRIYQILWNDPQEPEVINRMIEIQFSPIKDKEGKEIKDTKGEWAPNSRRGENIVFFGKPVVEEFLNKVGGKILIRSHEPEEKGYKIMFDEKLITIFSNGGGSPDSHYKEDVETPYIVEVNLEKEGKLGEGVKLKEIVLKEIPSAPERKEISDPVRVSVIEFVQNDKIVDSIKSEKLEENIIYSEFLSNPKERKYTKESLEHFNEKMEEGWEEFEKVKKENNLDDSKFFLNRFPQVDLFQIERTFLEILINRGKLEKAEKENRTGLLYLNLKLEHWPIFIKEFTKECLREDVAIWILSPFEARFDKEGKCMNINDFERSDAVEIQFDLDDTEKIFKILERIHKEEYFQEEIPRFAERAKKV